MELLGVWEQLPHGEALEHESAGRGETDSEGASEVSGVAGILWAPLENMPTTAVVGFCIAHVLPGFVPKWSSGMIGSSLCVL